MTSGTLSVSDDSLLLAGNAQCQKMLYKQGSCFPEPEKVKFSEKLIKINRKSKEQERILLITDKALYNLKPNDLSKCQRRIDLQSIASITMSTVSDEFSIHIPDEYDYRFKSKNRDRISYVISLVYEKITNNVLPIAQISQSSLRSLTITKDTTRLQTREERLRRYQELMEFDPTGSDDEEEQAALMSTPVSPRIAGKRSKRNANKKQKQKQKSKNTNDNENGNGGHSLDSTGNGHGDNHSDNHSTHDNSLNAVNQTLVTAEDFEFLKVIGRGSFGKVMQVRKKDSNEVLAMKILKKKAIIQRKQVEHTKAERVILQQLQHPFLMRLRYAFQTEVKLYFVLDYYRGGELFFHLKKKRRFKENEAQIIVAEVGLALGYLHELGVIYRDLKPENILLDIDGHTCLTDFGLSKQQNPSNLAHTFCGTPEYLAPEIVTNIGHTKAVDWWSLGILLYELTVGIPPFYSQNVNEMYKKIQSAPLQFPPQSSLGCKALVSLLLERDPSSRLGSGADDYDEIKRQPFFKNIDWIALYNKEIDAVYIPPTATQNADDSSCFDPQFTTEAPVDSYVTVKSLAMIRNAEANSGIGSANDGESKIFSDFGFAEN